MTKYQPFHDLPAGQYEALKRDIEARGIVLPALLDENGKTIDGHQRRRVAAELGIDCPTITIEGLSEDDKVSLAISLNTFRRHLTGVERSKAIQQMALLGMSVRRIADATGLSKSTVQREVSGVPSGTPESPPTVTTSGGPCGPPESDPEAGEVKASSGKDQSAEYVADAAGPDVDEQETAPAPSPAPKVPPRVVGRDGKSYPASKPKPEPSPLDDLSKKVSESDVGYRAAVSREFSKVRSGLLPLDPERAAAVALPEDRDAHAAMVADVGAWLDRFGKALRATTLRSVK